MFVSTTNFILIGQYWLVSGTDLSGVK